MCLETGWCTCGVKISLAVIYLHGLLAAAAIFQFRDPLSTNCLLATLSVDRSWIRRGTSSSTCIGERFLCGTESVQLPSARKTLPCGMCCRLTWGTAKAVFGVTAA